MFQTAAATAEAVNADAALTLIGKATALVMPMLFNAIGALLALVAGLWLAGRAKRIIRAAMARSGKIDETLGTFLASLLYYGLVALVIITTLGIFGVPTTSFAAIIGAAGLAIGLALQGTLGHVASGVMMLAFRPFSVGDFVETGGHSGTVKAMTLFTTEMATPDNKQVIIPNGRVWDNPIINYSANPTRRVDLVFGVAYSADLDKAFASIRTEIDKEARVRKDQEPVIAVDQLGDSSVNILCRVWVDTADYFAVKWALTKAVKERFDSDGVGIPFPTRTVIIEKGEAA